MYAIDHLDGSYPDSWQTLVKASSDLLEPHHFIGSNPGVAQATDFQQMLTEPGHISFVWVGGGVTDAAGSATLLAYEAPIASYEQGTWILLADGSVRQSRGDALIALLQSASRRLQEPLEGLPTSP